MTDLALAEVATRLSARAGAARAVGLVRDLLSSRRYEVVLLALSVPDCASFALMDALDLDTAFAFDTDFRDCGYHLVPAV